MERGGTGYSRATCTYGQKQKTMEARLTGAKRRALDAQSDTLSSSGAPATLDVAIICDDHPCATTSRACPGQSHCATPPVPERLSTVARTAISSDVEQDIDASMVNIDRTPCTVRAHSSPHPAPSPLVSQSGFPAHVRTWPVCSGSKDAALSNAPGPPEVCGASSADLRWSF